MSEHWQQVWQDIRGALGLPAYRTAAEAPAPATRVPQEQVTDKPGVAGETELKTVTVAPPLQPKAGEAFETDQSPPPPATSIWREWGPSILSMVGLGVVTWWMFFRPGPTPPAPDVVATFSGGQITIADVQAHIAVLDPDNLAQLQTPHGYLAVIEDIVSDELVRRWAKDRKIDSETEFQHAMEHITEAITLNDLLGQAHEGDIRVEESEIRAYYEANRLQYGDRLDDQTREAIRHQLVNQKETDYLADYLARLRKNASIIVDYSLLEVPAPTEAQLQQYFRDNQVQFIRPAAVIVDEIRVRATGDPAAAETQANEALTRLRTGEDWAKVAADVSVDPDVKGGISLPIGTRPDPYDQVVSAMAEAQVSNVFRAGDFFYIVRLNSRVAEQPMTFAEVRPQIMAAMQVEVETNWFEQVEERALFTLNGRRITAGKFYHEYQALPPEVRFQFSGPDGLRQLADKLVDRLLLAEDANNRFLTGENEAKIEETRLSILKQMLHQEEVEDKIKVTDEEVQTYYEQHGAHIVAPPQVRISYIRIGLGSTEDDWKRAQAKANEAYEKVAPAGFLGGGQGLDFAEVARQYSEDPDTAVQGGELPDWIGESYDVITELAEHPFHAQFIDLPIGGISSPFEYDGSLYIVKVRERRESQALTFEEAVPLIRAELDHQKHDMLVEQLTRQLLEQAQLIVYDEVLNEWFKTSTATTTVP